MASSNSNMRDLLRHDHFCVVDSLFAKLAATSRCLNRGVDSPIQPLPKRLRAVVWSKDTNRNGGP
jgi:hypothetical protein